MRSLVVLILTLSSINIGHAQWKTLKTGGGGWITGMDINPSGQVLIRSDVGGGYLYSESTNSWKQLVTSSSIPPEDIDVQKYQGVLSLVSAPSSESTIYMAYWNYVYKSSDTGSTWLKTNFPSQDMAPNDDASKISGERLAVDPKNPDHVYFGSIESGLWETLDGNNWERINTIPNGTPGRGVRSILFHPTSALIYVIVDGAGVFKSENDGMNWEEISNPLLSFGEEQYLDAELDTEGSLYVTAIDIGNGNYEPRGILKYDGVKWSQFFSEELSIAMGNLAVDPKNSDRVFVFSEGFSDIWRTKNASAASPSWELISYKVTAPNVPWISWIDNNWFVIGEVAFDPTESDKMWITFGVGTFYSTDLSDSEMTWVESNVGQEHLVSNDLTVLPNGNVISARWDFPIFTHAADKLDVYPQKHGPTSRFNSAWDVSSTPADPNFVTAVVEDRRGCCYDEGRRQSSYSMDGGITWVEFESNPGDPLDNHYGMIEISSSDIDNMVWLPVDNRNPFVTQDRGASWTEVFLPGNSGQCCISAYFFKRKVLAADKTVGGTFYLYDFGAGHIFRSTDKGKTWQRFEEVLKSFGYNAKLIAVPENEGHLFWANGIEQAEGLVPGLFRSVDGGRTWTEFANTSTVLNVSVGKAAPGRSYPSIFIQGRVNGVMSYYRSDDQGVNWIDLGQYPGGVYDAAAVLEGDMGNFGRVYVGFSGNGFLYQDAQAIVPVMLTSFTAKASNNDVQLEWQTSSEINTLLYDIERSYDNNNWTSLDTLPAKNDSNTLTIYDYLDLNPWQNSSVIYYRLKVVDKDGSIMNSEVISLNWLSNLESLGQEHISIVPNPAEDIVEIQFNHKYTSEVTIYSSNGELIQVLGLGQRLFDVSSFDPGIYFLKIVTKQEIHLKKFIKL